MDVSQLCSSFSDRPSTTTTTTTIIKSNNNDDNDNGLLERNIHNVDQQQVMSVDMILNQTMQLCKNIFQFHLEHEHLAEKERKAVMDELSNTAHVLFDAILQSNNNNDDDNNSNNNSNDNTDATITNNKRKRIERDGEEEEETETEVDEADEGGSNKSISTKDYEEYKLIRQARNLQSNQPRPKYRKRNRRSMLGQKCHSCNTTETPEWRRGPDGARTLCNACGLHYSKLLKKGSIGVQTHNYLTEPSMKQLMSSDNQTNDSNALAVSNSHYHEPFKLNINYPFVLMDPNYKTTPYRLAFNTSTINTPAPTTNNHLIASTTTPTNTTTATNTTTKYTPKPQLPSLSSTFLNNVNNHQLPPLSTTGILSNNGNSPTPTPPTPSSLSASTTTTPAALDTINSLRIQRWNQQQQQSD
ncbi:MAG: hypothetical protein EXX96DRAFT_611344 [Benjaminiella poitrasii]|nr:MAG: hypothetical protein EXX96DRAFT_611344 [Benjaminiella poitrasii]